MTDDEMNNESAESDDADYSIWYRRDIRHAIDLQNIFDELSEEYHINSIADIGCSISAIPILFGLNNHSVKQIVGIDPNWPQQPWNDIEQWNEFVRGKKHITYIEANIFNEDIIMKKMDEYGIECFDICYLHQTLHHLRRNNCQFKNHRTTKCKLDNSICNPYDCSDAVGDFDFKYIFEYLSRISHFIVISEEYFIKEDADKDGAQGGYISNEEMEELFRHLINNYNIVFYKPLRRTISKQRLRAQTNKIVKEIQNQLIHNDNILLMVNAK